MSLIVVFIMADEKPQK